MYSTFTIEHIDVFHAMGLAVVCDGDRLWIVTIVEEEA